MMQNDIKQNIITDVFFSGVMRGIDLIIEGFHGWTIGALMFCYFLADRVIRYSLLAHFTDNNTFNSTALKIESFDFEMVKRYCMLFCFCLALYCLYHRKKPIINFLVILQYVFYITVCFSTELNYGSNWTESVFRVLSVKEVFLTTVFFLAIGSNLSSKTMKKIMRFSCWIYIIILTFTNFFSLRMSFETDSTGLIELFRNYSLRVILRLEQSSSTVIWPHRLKGFYGNATSLGIRECIAILCAGWMLKNQKNRNRGLEIVYISVIILSLYLLLLSQSRTALLCIAVMLMFCFIFLMQKKMRISMSYLVAGAIILLASALIIYKYSAIFHRILHTDFTIPDEGVDCITSFRSQIFRELLLIYNCNQMLGAGWGTSFGKFETAHNYLLNVLGWTGNIGFFLVSVSSVLMLIQMVRNHERFLEDQWLICILICIWIISMLDQGILGAINSPFVYMFYLIAGYLSSPSFRKTTALM